MAKGKKTGGRNWAPGQSGNPKGGCGTTKEFREARKLTSQQFALLATEFLYLDKGELQKRLSNPTASMIELLVGGIVARAAKDQDYLRAEFLLNRILGKVQVIEDKPQVKPFLIRTRDGTTIECGMSDSNEDEGDD